MPRLSTEGRAVMGIAGLQTSVDGAVPAPLASSVGGGWAWLNTHVIVGQADFGTGYHFYSLDLDDDTLTMITTAGADRVVAGGDNWAVWNPGEGVSTNTGLMLPDAGLGSLSDTGAFAINTSYQTDNGLTMYSAAGALQRSASFLFVGQGALATRYRGDMLTYPTASGWPLVIGETGQAIRGYQQQQNLVYAIPVLLGSTRIMVEQNAADDVWTIRRFDMSSGLVVQTGTTAQIFWMDARGVGGLVRLAWSTGIGELPDELVLLDVNTATGETTRGTISGGMIVWAPGPTLEGTTFAMTGAASVYIPYQQPLMDKGKDVISRPWRDAFNQMANGIQAVTTTVNQLPPPINPATSAPMLLSDVPSPSLTNARQVIDSATIEWDFTTPGIASASVNGGVNGVPGIDGADGEDGIPIPGPAGPMGATGATGPQGAQGWGFAVDGEDGEDGLPIPGPLGPTGPTGATGATGPSMQLDSVGALSTASSTAEQTLYSFTVVGGTLGAGAGTGLYRLRLVLVGTFLNSSGSTDTMTIRVKFGATTMYEQATTWTSNAATDAMRIEVILGNKDATNDQFMWIEHATGNNTTPTTGISSLNVAERFRSSGAGTAAEDSTANKVFAVTIQHNVNNSNTNLARAFATLDLI